MIKGRFIELGLVLALVAGAAWTSAHEPVAEDPLLTINGVSLGMSREQVTTILPIKRPVRVPGGGECRGVISRPMALDLITLLHFEHDRVVEVSGGNLEVGGSPGRDHLLGAPDSQAPNGDGDKAWTYRHLGLEIIAPRGGHHYYRLTRAGGSGGWQGLVGERF